MLLAKCFYAADKIMLIKMMLKRSGKIILAKYGKNAYNASILLLSKCLWLYSTENVLLVTKCWQNAVGKNWWQNGANKMMFVKCCWQSNVFINTKR